MRGTRVCWAVLAITVLVTCFGTLRHDYRDATLVGDQASQLMQAVSLSQGGNLSYDAADLAHYEDATWRVRYRPPAGLLFQRNGDAGWAFAKPYGYSLVLAPFMKVLGPTRGVAAANTFLLLAVLAVCIALLRLRLDGPAVPLTAMAIVLVSNVVPYAYVLYVELFTALVVGLAAYGLLRAARDKATWAALLGFGACGLAVAEKSTLTLALGPLALVALARLPGLRAKVPAVAAGAVVFLLAVVPYWNYSNGETFSPYGGERYTTSGGAVPFSDPPAPRNRFERSGTDETLTVSYVRDALGESWRDKARSAATYVVGRHTGVLVFMPVAVVIAVLALLTGKRMGAPAIAILGGLALYAITYVVLFPHNYYGGGQSYGNRYFVQVCLLVAALAAAAPIPSRRLAVGALGSIAFGLVVLWPGVRHPSTAVEHIERTTALQRLFPFESNQTGAIRLECGVTTPQEQREACVAAYDP